jgi:hypothetical protein
MKFLSIYTTQERAFACPSPSAWDMPMLPCREPL